VTTPILVLVGALILAALVMVIIVTRLIYICAPNEVLIFVGGQANRLGRQLGYRVFKCGDVEYRGEELGPADLSRWKHFDVFAVPEELA